MITPYDLATSAEVPQPINKLDLLRLSRDLETEARASHPTQIRAALQDVRHLSGQTRRVYTALATHAEVVLLARGLPAYVAAGVRGVALDEDDPLVDQWCVVMAGGIRPVVLAAIDLELGSAVDLSRAVDQDRCFRYAVSRDPLVVAACLVALTEHDVVGRY